MSRIASAPIVASTSRTTKTVAFASTVIFLRRKWKKKTDRKLNECVFRACECLDTDFDEMRVAGAPNNRWFEDSRAGSGWSKRRSECLIAVTIYLSPLLLSVTHTTYSNSRWRSFLFSRYLPLNDRRKIVHVRKAENWHVKADDRAALTLCLSFYGFYTEGEREMSDSEIKKYHREIFHIQT